MQQTSCYCKQAVIEALLRAIEHSITPLFGVLCALVFMCIQVFLHQQRQFDVHRLQLIALSHATAIETAVQSTIKNPSKDGFVIKIG